MASSRVSRDIFWVFIRLPATARLSGLGRHTSVTELIYYEIPKWSKYILLL